MRKGYTRVPNSVWSDPRLDPDKRFTRGTKVTRVDCIALLGYIASHSKTWVFRTEVSLEHLGWGEQKYLRVLKYLKQSDFVKVNTVRSGGKVEGTKMQVEFEPARVWLANSNTANVAADVIDLTPENHGAENGLTPEKLGPENQGSYKKNNNKNAPTSERQSFSLIENPRASPLLSHQTGHLDELRGTG